jgi:hypothetical protein
MYQQHPTMDGCSQRLPIIVLTLYAHQPVAVKQITHPGNFNFE